jgi:predicted phosphoadenosine phosphosulfate sulfurtransferase
MVQFSGGKDSTAMLKKMIEQSEIKNKIDKKERFIFIKLIKKQGQKS